MGEGREDEPISTDNAQGAAAAASKIAEDARSWVHGEHVPVKLRTTHSLTAASAAPPPAVAVIVPANRALMTRHPGMPGSWDAWGSGGEGVAGWWGSMGKQRGASEMD